MDLTNYDDMVDTCPLTQHARYLDTVLFPGEMLFIPRHCWHFITAVNRDTAISFRRNEGIIDGHDADGEADHPYGVTCSVSFWWGSRIEVSELTSKSKAV